MQPTSRTAAEMIRSRLLDKQHVSPELVRSTLNDIPREDYDAWLDVLLDVGDIPDDGPDLPRDCIPYLPCPASTVLGIVEQAEVTTRDVFVDVGSGIGRAMFFVHLLTGARCIGIETQSSLMKLATERAERLNLTLTRFIQADAVDSIGLIATGTVFFLYCPFGGQRLERFLDRLERVARTMKIRLCCVHMAPLERPWLAKFGSSPEFELYCSQ